MADTSLIIGNGNWAVKETSLLGYNIIQSKYVPIEMTVSRATTATRVNSAGLIELVPRNLLTYSQQIDNADWVKGNAPTITTNIAVAPDGTTTADGIKADDAVNFKTISQTKTVTANSTVTTSVFVKKETSETNFGGFACVFSPTTKIFRVVVNAVTGTAVITNSTLTGTTNVEDYGTYWRISATTTDNGSNTSLNYSYYGTLSTNGTNIVQDVGSVRTVWGAQLETGPTATEYFPTTDRFNIPRVDYSTGTASLLVEPARTNEVLHSGDLSQAVWSKTNYALTSTTPIQGLTTTRITKNATSNGAYKNSQARTLNTIATFAAGTKTLTWLIRKGNTDKVGFLINNVLVGVLTSVSCEFDFTTQTFTNISLGLTASFENPTTDVYKIILTINDIGVTTSKAIWIAPIDNSNNTFDGGYLDFAFAQWEAGSNATSYIPTTISALARNADVISKTGISSLIGQTEGTLFVEINITTFNNGVFFSINDGTSANRIQMYKFTDNKIYCDRISATQSVTTSINSSALSVGTYKVAFAYQSGNSYLYINGAQVGATSAATFTFGSIGKVNIGSRFDDTSTFNDRIKSAILFPTRLSPGQLQTLTAII